MFTEYKLCRCWIAVVSLSRQGGNTVVPAQEIFKPTDTELLNKCFSPL